MVKTGLTRGEKVPVGVAVKVWVPVIFGVGLFFPRGLIFLTRVGTKVGDVVGLAVFDRKEGDWLCQTNKILELSGAAKAAGAPEIRTIRERDKYREE